MAARLFAFVIWAAVAASVVFWVLRVVSSPRPVPPNAVAVGGAGAMRGDLARLFGREGDPAAPAVAVPVATGSQFKLLGVVAPRGDAPNEGLALISVEGKPAKPYRIGASVDSSLVLLSVHQRGAALGPRDGAPSVNLELPPPAPAATGTLPATGSAAAPSLAPVVPVPSMAAPPAVSPDPPAEQSSLPPPVPGVAPPLRAASS